LPEKPSIAVLPFSNMSGDRDQEYFSDGITDDLITGLSRLPGLFVIARNSTFTYKGKAAPLQEVSKELGVKYVLEGSVRKAADQLRITARLADATTGAELWAERYDRPLRDVFALQDEIVRRIVTTLNLQLVLSQQGVLISRTTENLEAYDDVLRGEEDFLLLTKDGNVKAREMFEEAIRLDPKYSLAYALLSWNYQVGWVLSLNPDPNGLKRALHLAQQATALDDSLDVAHSVLAIDYVHSGQYDPALNEAQRGVALDPNSAFGYFALAEVLNQQWKPAEALAAAEKAMRLDPRNTVNYAWDQGWAYTLLGRWEEAINLINSFVARNPNFLWAHAYLAVDYFNVGDRDGAQAETAEVERRVALTPNSAVGYWALGFTLNEQGKPLEALAAAQQGIRLDPQNSGIILLRGIIYGELGRWTESLADLKRYVALHPNDIWGHGFLAGAYAALDQMNAARAEAGEVLRLDPQFSLKQTATPYHLDKERFVADLSKSGLQ
jgi:adenylate cyclase